MSETEESQANEKVGPPGPAVLAIIICDTIIRDETSHKVSLIGLFNRIAGYNFPCQHPRMSIYMAMAGGHGKHSLEVRISHTDEPERFVVTLKGPVKFANPLQVVELNLECRDLVFQKPGEYIVEVLCDGQPMPGTRRFYVGQLEAIQQTGGSEVI